MNTPSILFKTSDALTHAIHATIIRNNPKQLSTILMEAKLLFIASLEQRTKTLVESLVDALVIYTEEFPDDAPNKIRDVILSIHNASFPEPSPDDPMKVFINRDIHCHNALLFNSLEESVANELVNGVPSSQQSTLNIESLNNKVRPTEN